MGLRHAAALAAILLSSPAAHAGVAEELTAAINNCAAITDEGSRHACYDRLPALAKSLAAAPVAAAQPNVSPTTEGKGSSSGTFDLFGGEAPSADSITATVESFTFDYGVFVVTLDNGQVWRQVAAIADRVPLARDTKNRVTIWHSRFGYFVLKIEGFHTNYRVRRIK